MTSFSTFDFTCGNFTVGNGYYSGANVTNETVRGLLLAGGEKNCQVIFQHQGPPSGRTKNEFEYRVTSRWYTSVAHTAVLAAPFILPVLIPPKPE
jgi:hypothetical protein